VAIFAYLATMLIPLTLDVRAFYFPQSAMVLAVLAAMIVDGLKPVLHWSGRSSRVM
jgi:hypothetical protein